MQQKSSDTKYENYGNDANIVMIIARSEIKDLIAEKVDSLYAERTWTEEKTQIEEALVDMLQLGKCAAAYRISTVSIRLQEKMIIELFWCGDADDVSTKWFTRLWKSETFISAVIKQFV